MKVGDKVRVIGKRTLTGQRFYNQICTINKVIMDNNKIHHYILDEEYTIFLRGHGIWPEEVELYKPITNYSGKLIGGNV